MSTALLIIDMQKAILDGKGTLERQPEMQKALDAMAKRLAQVLYKARNAGIKVVMVQHDGEEGHRLEKGTEGWEFRPEFSPLSAEFHVHKTSSDAFFETTLGACLTRLNILRVMIGGCMSEFCVDTTVRSAVAHGYDVTLLGDGHMTADNEVLTFDQIIAHHNATLDGFDAGMATVNLINCEDVVF